MDESALHSSFTWYTQLCTLELGLEYVLTVKREVGPWNNIFCSADSWAVHLSSFITKNKGVFSSSDINQYEKSQNNRHAYDFVTPNKCLLHVFSHGFQLIDVQFPLQLIKNEFW